MCVFLFLRVGMVRGRKARHSSCVACGRPFMLDTGQNVAKHPKLDAFLCQVRMNFMYICMYVLHMCMNYVVLHMCVECVNL